MVDEDSVQSNTMLHEENNKNRRGCCSYTLRSLYELDRVMVKSYYYSKRLLSVIAALNKMTFVMS